MTQNISINNNGLRIFPLEIFCSHISDSKESCNLIFNDDFFSWEIDKNIFSKVLSRGLKVKREKVAENISTSILLREVYDLKKFIDFQLSMDADDDYSFKKLELSLFTLNQRKIACKEKNEIFLWVLSLSSSSTPCYFLLTASSLKKFSGELEKIINHEKEKELYSYHKDLESF